jgi:hypothetical protein
MALQAKDWVVYSEEKETLNKWVDMPENIIGKPLFEHWNYYIAVLPSGERVMVRKRDSFVFENGNSTNSDKSHLATKDELDKLLFMVRKKALFKRLFESIRLGGV